MIRNNIREWRAQRGLGGITKAHLARRVGVSRSYIARVESGAREPSADVMFRIAQYFGCGVEQVFHYETTPSERK